jgi:hypothetical protein
MSFEKAQLVGTLNRPHQKLDAIALRNTLGHLDFCNFSIFEEIHEDKLVAPIVLAMQTNIPVSTLASPCYPIRLCQRECARQRAYFQGRQFLQLMKLISDFNRVLHISKKLAHWFACLPCRLGYSSTTRNSGYCATLQSLRRTAGQCLRQVSDS